MKEYKEMKNMISGEQKLDKRINGKRKMPLKIARSNSNILNPL